MLKLKTEVFLSKILLFVPAIRHLCMEEQHKKPVLPFNEQAETLGHFLALSEEKMLCTCE